MVSLSFKAEVEEDVANGDEAETKTKQEWVVVDGAIVFLEETVELKSDD